MNFSKKQYICNARFRHASHLNSVPGRNFYFLFCEVDMEYTKSAKSITDIISMLQSRGLIISDTDKAMDFLSKVSYFRFAAYLRPLEIGKRIPINREPNSRRPCLFTILTPA